jgi:hypothetical protein
MKSPYASNWKCKSDNCENMLNDLENKGRKRRVYCDHCLEVRAKDRLKSYYKNRRDSLAN